RGLIMRGLDLLENFRRHAAGRTVLLQALQHFAFGGEEGLEQLAQFLRGNLLLAGQMDCLAVLGGLVADGQKLLAGYGRLRRRAESSWGHPRRSGHARHPSKLRRGRRKRRNGEHEHPQKSPAERHVTNPPAARFGPADLAAAILTAL